MKLWRCFWWRWVYSLLMLKMREEYNDFHHGGDIWRLYSGKPLIGMSDWKFVDLFPERLAWDAMPKLTTGCRWLFIHIACSGKTKVDLNTMKRIEILQKYRADDSRFWVSSGNTDSFRFWKQEAGIDVQYWFAPFWNALKNSAPGGIFDEVEIMADQGFRSLEDNGFAQRDLSKIKIGKNWEAFEWARYANGGFCGRCGDNWKNLT